MAWSKIDASADSTSESLTANHWSVVSSDPNDQAVLNGRAQVLAAAWRPKVRDRTDFIIERIRGKRVLDIGCVAHDEDRMNSSEWLHRFVAVSAAECLGVDILESGIEAMTQAGYNAVAADLSANPNALVGHGLFQVIVAGELIEHVGDLNMLFAVAEKYLTCLLYTSPSPRDQRGSRMPSSA